jgi:hypothetical protein
MNCAMMKVRCKVPLSRATGAHVHIPESVQYTIIIFFFHQAVYLLLPLLRGCRSSPPGCPTGAGATPMRLWRLHPSHSLEDEPVNHPG